MEVTENTESLTLVNSSHSVGRFRKIADGKKCFVSYCSI